MIKHNVRITSGSFTTPSAIAVWTVNLLTCNQKYRDWITAKSPVQSLSYDVRNPPGSSLLATYAYLGPSITVCGNPTITVANDANGAALSFLTATFDSVSGNIAISLPNKNTAVKGTYALRAVFTLPGSFSFTLGISLTVFDVCDSSTFDAAPLLLPDNQYYYIG